MKKLLCLFIITTLVTGCTSRPSKEDKKEDTKITETDKNNESKKEDEEELVDDSMTKQNDDSSNSKNANQENNSTSSTANTDNKSNSTNTNGNNNGGDAKPPKQETPTPPKEETPPSPPVPATPTEQRAKANAVMGQINAYRQQNGKPAFLITNYLLDSSNRHAYAMAEKRALWHSGAAECVTNYDDPFSAWVNSSEHNKLLLSNNETGAVSIYYVDGYFFSVFQTLP